MTVINRHSQSIEGTEKRIAALSKNIDRFYDNLGEAPALALNVAQYSLQVTQRQLLLDPAADRFDTYSSLLVAARSGAALFKSANTSDEHFDCIIRDRVSLNATGPTHKHSPAAWLDALWSATICRARNLVDDLCQTPEETLRAAGQYDEYVYAWIDALKTFFTSGDDLHAKINRSIELTDPAQLGNDAAEIALLRYFPSMKLLFSLASGEAGQFNEDLREAIELHRRFWTANTNRAAHPDGFLALAPTALAAVAHDRGITADIESEYLPRNFVTGYWVNQTETDQQ
ncbi:immunity 49 family protein [Saccharopolyspora flava]|uniref:Immunity protein 49 n=1 Tax=Saccharopolyspora flava TaxID=95161 RepID=A0A1I6TYI6_9PSEU|nr:immunity 49 family protein [Saccharopolyspora flava]SFS94252.1 Immunity protein 49 [Saccharopolyspora flava]